MTQKSLTYTEVLMGSTLSTPKHICLVTAPAPPLPAISILVCKVT